MEQTGGCVRDVARNLAVRWTAAASLRWASDGYIRFEIRGCCYQVTLVTCELIGPPGPKNPWYGISPGAPIFQFESPEASQTFPAQPGWRCTKSEVRKMVAYAPRLHPGRGLGGSHSDGEDLSLRLLQRLALRQQHHELKSWGGGDKVSEGELLGNHRPCSRLFAKRATAGGEGPDYLSCTMPAHCRRRKKLMSSSRTTVRVCSLREISKERLLQKRVCPSGHRASLPSERSRFSAKRLICWCCDLPLLYVPQTRRYREERSSLFAFRRTMCTSLAPSRVKDRGIDQCQATRENYDRFWDMLGGVTSRQKTPKVQAIRRALATQSIPGSRTVEGPRCGARQCLPS